jgi:hypothetical protein
MTLHHPTSHYTMDVANNIDKIIWEAFVKKLKYEHANKIKEFADTYKAKGERGNYPMMFCINYRKEHPDEYNQFAREFLR